MSRFTCPNCGIQTSNFIALALHVETEVTALTAPLSKGGEK